MTVTMASKEQMEEFESKLFSKDYKAIERKITIRAVEFLPIKELNQKLDDSSKNIEGVIEDYVSKNQIDLILIAENMKEVLTNQGLCVEQVSISSKPYSPFTTFLNALTSGSVADFKEVLEKQLGITPPQH